MTKVVIYNFTPRHEVAKSLAQGNALCVERPPISTPCKGGINTSKEFILSEVEGLGDLRDVALSGLNKSVSISYIGRCPMLMIMPLRGDSYTGTDWSLTRRALSLPKCSPCQRNQYSC